MFSVHRCKLMYWSVGQCDAYTTLSSLLQIGTLLLWLDAIYRALSLLEGCSSSFTGRLYAGAKLQENQDSTIKRKCQNSCKPQQYILTTCHNDPNICQLGSVSSGSSCYMKCISAFIRVRFEGGDASQYGEHARFHRGIHEQWGRLSLNPVLSA